MPTRRWGRKIDIGCFDGKSDPVSSWFGAIASVTEKKVRPTVARHRLYAFPGYEEGKQVNQNAGSMLGIRAANTILVSFDFVSINLIPDSFSVCPGKTHMTPCLPGFCNSQSKLDTIPGF